MRDIPDVDKIRIRIHDVKIFFCICIYPVHSVLYLLSREYLFIVRKIFFKQRRRIKSVRALAAALPAMQTFFYFHHFFLHGRSQLC